MPHGPLIGSADASRLLDIDRSTLNRWVSAGKITPAARVSDTPTGAHLFLRTDVERLVKAKEPAA